jgi:hypothetical protein
MSNLRDVSNEKPNLTSNVERIDDDNIEKHVEEICLKIKPIELITPKTDQCCICYQPYTKDTQIDECQQCHQHLHTECQIIWSISNLYTIPNPTCPFCRALWQNSQNQLFPLTSIS